MRSTGTRPTPRSLRGSASNATHGPEDYDHASSGNDDDVKSSGDESSDEGNDEGSQSAGNADVTVDDFTDDERGLGHSFDSGSSLGMIEQNPPMRTVQTNPSIACIVLDQIPAEPSYPSKPAKVDDSGFKKATVAPTCFGKKGHTKCLQAFNKERDGKVAAVAECHAQNERVAKYHNILAGYVSQSQSFMINQQANLRAQSDKKAASLTLDNTARENLVKDLKLKVKDLEKDLGRKQHSTNDEMKRKARDFENEIKQLRRHAATQQQQSYQLQRHAATQQQQS